MFKLLSVALLALMATFIKLLGKSVPIGETVFVRGMMAILVLGLIAHHTTGLQVLKTSNWKRHAMRSLAGTGSMFCYFASLSLIPLADYTAITFASPIFITILAMIFLGERIHAFRWTALVVGLSGVAIMIAPQISSQHGNGLGAVLALGGALSGAVAITTLRSMSRTEPAITITFYFLVTAMICALMTIFFGWVVPTKQQAIWMLLAALSGVLGQLSMTTGYKYAEASTLAPLDYAAMIMAVVIGYFVFSEVPSLWIWVGSALVISAGLVIIWREFHLNKRITTVA
ncbi:MAG TPA: DMT family transporter [Steroidobacteraceae bacterium]|jgi:drug/metabolite transporter (DMT)-like permease|nr:DMT family transporter [Steroidobacteraceae bacterium]